MTEVKITDIEVGTGPEAAKGALVLCHYTGFLRDGTKFDSSVDRGKVYEFVIGSKKVIQGWSLGVTGMKAGGKRKIEVPAHLAYGERSVGRIPPHSDLFYDVEVFEVRPREE